MSVAILVGPCGAGLTGEQDYSSSMRKLTSTMQIGQPSLESIKWIETKKKLMREKSEIKAPESP